MQDIHNGPNVGSGIQVALAFWLDPAEEAAIAAAADERLATANPPAALIDARHELDAATIRARWFDTPQAENHRRVARLDPHSIAARLTRAEVDALIACDPALVSPLLHPSHQPAPRAASKADAETPPPTAITLPTGAGPVLVLERDDADGIAWALGEYVDGTVQTTRPGPHDGAWREAWQQSQLHTVDTDTERGARRLVVRGLPGLSSLSLAHPEHHPRPGETVLLRLPHIVAVAPAPLAARIAEFAYPADIQQVTSDELPAVPGHPTGLTL